MREVAAVGSIALWLSGVLAACSGSCATGGDVRNPSSPTVSGAAPAAPVATAAAPSRGAPGAALQWVDLTPATFARAKAERRFIVLDGAAEWCHWCHVMEAETYHDAKVQQILGASFIPVKVDIDARPDLQERYGDYGWPATVIFSPEGAELGKYRGFIEPAKFAEMLEAVVAAGAEASAGTAAEPAKRAPSPPRPLSDAHLEWISHVIEVELAEYWDREQGGWGRMQKSPIGSNNEWLLWKAGRGDDAAQRQVMYALDQQAKLLDPVWGGIYQYSTGGVWTAPHFEKLMTYQAPALENYARAYQLTRDAKQLARAQAMRGYLERFLKGPEGGFYCTQDADLNAHDPTKPFLTGHDYYAKDEAGRLALGLPRVDAHEYGRENGLAIAAYVTFYEVTKDTAALAVAERAAERVLSTHLTARGGITHDLRQELPPDAAARGEVLYLSDNAGFGFGLIRLYEVTHRAAYLERAQALAAFLLAEMADPSTGALFSSTVDPAAVGVLAIRRVPSEDNVMALRFFAHLAHAAPASGPGAALTAAIARMLPALMQPEQMKARGRFLGDLLLALEETRGVRG
jgi:uncharacterized protein